MVLIGHFSDLHGNLAPLRGTLEREPDLWISTGDILAEDRQRPISKQAAVQHDWITKYLEFFKRRFGDKPVLMVNGNHCWIDPVPRFQEAGIDARAVDLRVQKVLGLTYAGFPYINPVDNPAEDVDGKKIKWNYERFAGEMQELVDTFFSQETPELLITHSPAAGILDKADSGLRYGISPLASKLFFSYHEVRYHFFGHIHQSAGMIKEGGITFSNASCRLQFVEVT